MTTVPFQSDRRPPLTQPDWATLMETALEIDDDARWKAADRGLRIIDSNVSSVRVRIIVDRGSHELARAMLGRDVVPYLTEGDVWSYRGSKDGIRVEIVGVSR